ncbi:hypothetical protein ACFQ9Q_06230 [Streptomyces virginiae]|uniref:hypothetical protein n=1 Tax=Streptomyces virginiae TaxID=1961 RepID=UPI0036BD31AC
MTMTDYGADDAYWTGLEDYEPDPVTPSVTRTVRNAPPGVILNTSPWELRVGDWLVLGSTAYEITNMFSPGFDSSVKRVILRGYAPQMVSTRHEIVRAYVALHRAPRRSW